jgi:hypothetical protein
MESFLSIFLDPMTSVLIVALLIWTHVRRSTRAKMGWAASRPLRKVEQKREEEKVESE